MEQVLKSYYAAQERLRMEKQNMDDMRKELGYVIRFTREKKGMSAVNLARAVKISAPFLYDLELGRRSVTGDKLEKIAEALKS